MSSAARNFRFVPVSPERSALWSDLGSAFGLHDLLTHLQCDPNGRINYGRAITYAWILKQWPGAAPPSLRTMKRQMTRLKKTGLVEVRQAGRFHGMVVRLVGSVKFAPAPAPPAVQLSLFSRPVTPIRKEAPVDKPVENELKTIESPDYGSATSGTPAAGRSATSVPQKQLKKQAEETDSAPAAARAAPSAVEIPDPAEQLRLLRAGLSLAIETVAASRAIPELPHQQTEREFNDRRRILAAQAEALGRLGLDYPSLKEDLKRWASTHGVAYDADAIDLALDDSERKTKRRSAG